VTEFITCPNSQIFFFDEGRFGLQPQIGRCWSLRGKKATSMVNPGYKNFYVYSSVSPLNGNSFSLFLPLANTEVMSLYLQELSLAYADQNLLIIMDQAGWHRAKDLVVPKNIQIDFLPPYSPELNPVERLWLWLRRHVCRNRLFESIEELMDELQQALTTLPTDKVSSLCRANYLLHIN
jgi:transposase